MEKKPMAKRKTKKTAAKKAPPSNNVEGVDDRHLSNQVAPKPEKPKPLERPRNPAERAMFAGREPARFRVGKFTFRNVIRAQREAARYKLKVEEI